MTHLFFNLSITWKRFAWLVSCLLVTSTTSLIDLLRAATLREDPSDAWWEQGSTMVAEEGTTVTVTCKVSRVQFFDVLRIRLVQGNQSLSITDNGDIKQPFSHFGRYLVLYEYVNDVASTTITYTGIKGEDSGLLVCQKLSSSSALLDLKVTVPPTFARMYFLQSDVISGHVTIDQVIHGQILELEETKLRSIRCVGGVVSSSEPPLVVMRVGGAELNALPYFNTSLYNTKPPHPLRRELLKYATTTAITYTTEKPNPHHHGRILSCTTSTQPVFKVLRMSVLLKVRFIPMITCNVTSYEARLGDNLVMECLLESNPESEVQWRSVHRDKVLEEDKYFHFQEIQESLSSPTTSLSSSSPPSSPTILRTATFPTPYQVLPAPSSSSSSSSTSALSSSSSSSSSSAASSSSLLSYVAPLHRKRVMMTITKVKESHFGLYALTATNELGSSTAAMTLSKMAANYVVHPYHKTSRLRQLGSRRHNMAR